MHIQSVNRAVSIDERIRTYGDIRKALNFNRKIRPMNQWTAPKLN
jgi:hypothetical protein